MDKHVALSEPERRLRHKAAKRGLKMVKSRSRDVQAHDFGLWGLRDVRTGNFVNPALVDRYRVVGGSIRSQTI